MHGALNFDTSERGGLVQLVIMISPFKRENGSTLDIMDHGMSQSSSQEIRRMSNSSCVDISTPFTLGGLAPPDSTAV